MIDETKFATAAELQSWCDRLGEAGLRNTGSRAHEEIIDWIEAELKAMPGIEVRSEPFEISNWCPVPEGDLSAAGKLTIGSRLIPIAGAVPYSRPAEGLGQLVVIPRDQEITAENASGKVIVREFPIFQRPFDTITERALFATPDIDELRGSMFNRPGRADLILHLDLLAAGAAGAVGMVIAFDVPREQIAGYFEPHKGTHYAVPAVFVGVDEREILFSEAALSSHGTVQVNAVIERVVTRNVIAKLPGESEERVALITHTDGNTWVQENGPAALLGLARYFAGLDREDRHRTLEFAFCSAHLHISREGSRSYASDLDKAYDGGSVAFSFAVEHLGVLEITAVPRDSGVGRQLEFTGQAEPLLWSVGPSEPLRVAARAAVERRQLPRVIGVPGLGPEIEGQVPRIASFGGIGTYFHCLLVPSTCVMTGPWSLWAPAFGSSAIDIDLYRKQALAVGDVIRMVDRTPRLEIAGGYLADRAARAAGAPEGIESIPPEFATGAIQVRLSNDGYPLPA